MSRYYPVEIGRHDGRGDIPPSDHVTIGIFTRHGYWLPTPAGLARLEFSDKDVPLAEAVAAAINQAYEHGREDMKRAFRELLDVKNDADREDW